MRKPSVDNWIDEKPSIGHRFNSLRAAEATIHESSLSASPDDSLVIENDSLKNESESTMALDSLQCPKEPIPSVNYQQPDSLSDAFAKNNGGFFDSMEEEVASVPPSQGVNGKKKLIIPYATDSYSSNKSLSTSQEEDDDEDDEEEEDEDEEDVDEESSAVVKDVPIELARPHPQTVMTSRRPVSASPALAGAPVSGHRLLPNPPNNLRRMSSGSNPDLRHGLCPNLNGPFPAKRLPESPPSAAVVGSPVVVSPSQQQQQSLMRMATERMKRKFLGGWN